MLPSRSVTKATNTPNGWRRSDQMNRLLVIEQHGRKSLGLVVPHKDDDLILGDGLLIIGCRHNLRPLAQFGLELLIGIRINLLALEVEQHDGSFLLESLIEHEDVRQAVLGGFDQIVVAMIPAFLFGHRRLLSIRSPGPWSSPPDLSRSSCVWSHSMGIFGIRFSAQIKANKAPIPAQTPMSEPLIAPTRAWSWSLRKARTRIPPQIPRTVPRK